MAIRQIGRVGCRSVGTVVPQDPWAELVAAVDARPHWALVGGRAEYERPGAVSRVVVRPAPANMGRRERFHLAIVNDGAAYTRMFWTAQDAVQWAQTVPLD
jgi:hypothetical protein